MAFRGKEMVNRVLKMTGDDMTPGVKESLKKCIPDSRIVMGRAKHGIFAGRHMQFGNRVGEDGGNKSSAINSEGGEVYDIEGRILFVNGDDRSRKTWKPEVQEKRLFSFILDRHI